MPPPAPVEKDLVPSGRVTVRVRRFVVTRGHKWVLYDSVEEGGGRGSASGLWLEGRLSSMLTVLLGGDLDLDCLGPKPGS